MPQRSGRGRARTAYPSRAAAASPKPCLRSTPAPSRPPSPNPRQPNPRQPSPRQPSQWQPSQWQPSQCRPRRRTSRSGADASAADPAPTRASQWHREHCRPDVATRTSPSNLWLGEWRRAPRVSPLPLTGPGRRETVVVGRRSGNEAGLRARRAEVFGRWYSAGFRATRTSHHRHQPAGINRVQQCCVGEEPRSSLGSHDARPAAVSRREPPPPGTRIG